MFSISLIVCKYSYAEFAWLKRITLCFDSCDLTKGIKWHNALQLQKNNSINSEVLILIVVIYALFPRVGFVYV